MLTFLGLVNIPIPIEIEGVIELTDGKDRSFTVRSDGLARFKDQVLNGWYIHGSVFNNYCDGGYGNPHLTGCEFYGYYHNGQDAVFFRNVDTDMSDFRFIRPKIYNNDLVSVGYMNGQYYQLSDGNIRQCECGSHEFNIW